MLRPGTASSAKALLSTCRVLHSRYFHTSKIDAKCVDAIKRFRRHSPKPIKLNLEELHEEDPNKDPSGCAHGLGACICGRSTGADSKLQRRRPSKFQRQSVALRNDGPFSPCARGGWRRRLP